MRYYTKTTTLNGWDSNTRSVMRTLATSHRRAEECIQHDIMLHDPFQRATSGFHTLAHIGWTIARQGGAE